MYEKLSRELITMKVTMTLIVIGALRTIPKGFVSGLEVLEIRGRAETIQSTTLLRSARIMKRLLDIEETSCHSDSRARRPAHAGVIIIRD